MRRFVPVLLAVVAVGACGNGGGSEPASAPATPSAAPTISSVTPSSLAPAEPDLPAVQVVDVATGERVALRSLVPAAKPLLVWLWAPH